MAMKALVLDGSRRGDERTIKAAAATAASLGDLGYETEVVALRDIEIAACTGCFGCWTKTPGECVVADASRDIVARFIGSDLVAFVTPVTFGGYSSELKKWLDRFIAVVDPRFQVYQGEVHHRLRYPRYPRVISVGTLPAADSEAEEIFHLLAERNGKNLHTVIDSMVLVGDGDASETCAAVGSLVARKAVA